MRGTKEILSRIREGNTIDNLAEELDMNKSTLLAMIEFMIDEGYLEKISRHGRSTCPLSSKCSAKFDDSTARMYVLTLKGEKFISEGS
jgi:hypothetical protein